MMGVKFIGNGTGSNACENVESQRYCSDDNIVYPPRIFSDTQTQSFKENCESEEFRQKHNLLDSTDNETVIL